MNKIKVEKTPKVTELRTVCKNKNMLKTPKYGRCVMTICVTLLKTVKAVQSWGLLLCVCWSRNVHVLSDHSQKITEMLTNPLYAVCKHSELRRGREGRGSWVGWGRGQGEAYLDGKTGVYGDKEIFHIQNINVKKWPPTSQYRCKRKETGEWGWEWVAWAGKCGWTDLSIPKSLTSAIILSFKSRSIIVLPFKPSPCLLKGILERGGNCVFPL